MRPTYNWWLRRLAPVAAAGVLIGGAIAVVSRPAVTPPQPDQPPAQFSARYISPDPAAPWRLPVVNSGQPDQSSRFDSCDDMVAALVPTGAAGWSDQPVEISVNSDRRAAVDISITVKPVAVEKSPRLASAVCVPGRSAAAENGVGRRPHLLTAPLLDGQESIARFDNAADEDAANDENLVSTYSFDLALGAGETQQFWLRPQLDDAIAISWILEIHVDVNGVSQVIELDNGGKPFVTVGRPLRDDPSSGFIEWCEDATDNRIHQTDSPANSKCTAEVGGADQTQAAFVRDGTLFALAGDNVHPVYQVDLEQPVTVDWSADRATLVGTNGDTVFSWTGDQPAAAEAPCEQCSATYLDPPGGAGTLVTMRRDGTIERRDPQTLRPTGSVRARIEDNNLHFTLHGVAGGMLLVSHPRESTSAYGGPDTLWLVDPDTGEVRATYDPDTNVAILAIAVSADGTQVAVLSARHISACNEVAVVNLLRARDLTPLAQPKPLVDLDDGGLSINDLFFNGNRLYAVMSTWTGDVDNCTDPTPPSLWRLDENQWHRIDPGPLKLVRPLDGADGYPAKIITTTDGSTTLQRIPVGSGKTAGLDIGYIQSPGYGQGLWSAPTRTEIDLSPN
jgi:hypothetical protein